MYDGKAQTRTWRFFIKLRPALQNPRDIALRDAWTVVADRQNVAVELDLDFGSRPFGGILEQIAQKLGQIVPLHGKICTVWNSDGPSNRGALGRLSDGRYQSLDGRPQWRRCRCMARG